MNAYRKTPSTLAVSDLPDVAPAPKGIAPNGPITRLPPNFDLSRFGPHVRAAYLGPTPDNPFLSLKNRLKRARFYDQRERQAGTDAAVR